MASQRVILDPVTASQPGSPLVREPEGVTLSEQRVPNDPEDEDYEDFKENRLTELHLAASEDHKEDVEALLAAHADPNAANSSGWTALHYAAHEGHRDIVQLLLKAGANVDTYDDNNRSPLH
jgi:ankyrin repeat protein